MGYFANGLTGHEGYALGHVTPERCIPGSGIYRELAYPLDDHDRDVEMISAGCECGWRSARWQPRTPARWVPYMTILDPADEELVIALWTEHAEAMAYCRNRTA